MNGNQIPLVNSFYFKTPQVEKKSSKSISFLSIVI